MISVNEIYQNQIQNCKLSCCCSFYDRPRQAAKQTLCKVKEYVGEPTQPPAAVIYDFDFQPT